MSTHFQRGSALFQLRRYEDAEHELRRALVEHPDDAIAHGLLGIALSRLDRLREAEDAVETAIECDPTQSYVFYAHSLVMIRLNRSAVALTSIREAIRLDPLDVDYLVILAALLYDKQRWHECLDTLDRGLAASPEHVRSLNLRGKVLRELDRWEDASRSFDAALQIDPENADSHHARGALLLARGESEAAVEHLLEARRLDPISKNDRDSIAIALGRQLPPFRWLVRHNLHWQVWRPKATWALFMALVLVYMGLNYLFPHNKNGSRPALYFGLATLNLLLLPISSGFLSTGAALLFKRRMIGAPWYKPFHAASNCLLACWDALARHGHRHAAATDDVRIGDRIMHVFYRRLEPKPARWVAVVDALRGIRRLTGSPRLLDDAIP